MYLLNSNSRSFLHILATAPPCNIVKGTIQGIYAKMLAYSIGNVFRFYFLCISVFCRYLHQIIPIDFLIVKHGMSYLMHHCL